MIVTGDLIQTSLTTFQSAMKLSPKMGDRVQAHFGGPVMLIVDDLCSCAVIVAWKDVEGHVHEEEFNRVELKLVREARQK